MISDDFGICSIDFDWLIYVHPQFEETTRDMSDMCLDEI